MKIKLIATTIILTATLSTSLTTHAADLATNLCEYAASDDKKRMRNFLKDNKLKIRSVFKGIQCNGKNLLEFADSRNSTNVGVFIIAKLPKKSVKSSMANLTNADLQAKAADRTKA
jgi:hypothetical protein